MGDFGRKPGKRTSTFPPKGSEHAFDLSLGFSKDLLDYIMSAVAVEGKSGICLEKLVNTLMAFSTKRNKGLK